MDKIARRFFLRHWSERDLQNALRAGGIANAISLNNTQSHAHLYPTTARLFVTTTSEPHNQCHHPAPMIPLHHPCFIILLRRSAWRSTLTSCIYESMVFFSPSLSSFRRFRMPSSYPSCLAYTAGILGTLSTLQGSLRQEKMQPSVLSI